MWEGETLDIKQCGGDVRAVGTERHHVPLHPSLPVGIPRMLQQCGNRPSSHHPLRLFNPPPSPLSHSFSSPPPPTVFTKLTTAPYWTCSKQICFLEGLQGRKEGTGRNLCYCCSSINFRFFFFPTEKEKKEKEQKSVEQGSRCVHTSNTKHPQTAPPAAPPAAHT